MKEFDFRVLSLTTCSPKKWLEEWADQNRGDDDEEYKKLCEQSKNPSLDYFVRIGKWKEGIKKPTHKGWRENVASVAYVVWMQAERERPRCPARTASKNFWTSGLREHTQINIETGQGS